MFRSKCRLNTFFRFKDSLEKKNSSGIIHRHTCNNYKVTYYEKPSANFTRVAEHMGIFNLTRKHLKNVKKLAISEHLLQCNCAIKFDDFSILATDSNKFRLLLRDSLLIKHHKPILKRTIKTFPFDLFDGDDSFYFQYHMIVRFLFNIYVSDFVACTDRARICFKMLS